MIVAVFLFTTLFFTSGHHLGTTGTIEEKENPMKNTLLDKGIITPSGEINKDKISLVAGAITQPFAEMVWVTTGGDMETINRLTDVLVSMNTPADRGKLFKIIKMLYGLMGLPFSEEAEPMDAAPDVLEYFVFINGFAQLFRELFFALVGSRMDKEDNTCVLAHPLAVLHKLGKLSLAEVSRDTADIHTDNIAVFVGIHSSGVDCGECLLELLKRAIKGDFDIVIETAVEAQDACFLVLVGHPFAGTKAPPPV